MKVNAGLRVVAYKIFVCFVVAFVIFSRSHVVNAQSNFSVSGYVKDADTGEDLVGATIYAPALSKGTTTNAYGFFSLSLPADSVQLVISYIGYQQVSRRLLLNRNTQLTIVLSPEKRELQEVVVQAESLQDKLNQTQMSVEKLNIKEIKLVPAIFGEVDIIKVLQLKPGIQSGGEGASGLYVRGGGPDQNLVLLDEATVYNAAHLFGFFSIFNPDAVKGVDLYKGDFPAQYGGRLSSVVDVKLKDGNDQKFTGSGGIGAIASRLTLEGPLVKNKSSFVLSGRRTYFDAFTRALNRANRDNEDYNEIPDYYFYDLNAKVNYDLGEKDRLFVSGYLGRDKFGFQGDNFNINFNWGNNAATVRWNHIFSPKLFANTSLIYSDYKYTIENKFDIFSFTLGSTIRDLGAKTDFYYTANANHTIRFGGQYTHHTFDIGRLQADSEDGTIAFNSGQGLTGSEIGAYVSSELTAGPLWRFNSGLRFSGFENKGKWFGGVEPRLAARYKLSENTSLKASASRMYQYVHLVANSGASLPTDIWYPSGRLVQPQRSDQLAAGISTLLFKGKLLLTNEVYYKWMKNQLDFRDGAQLFVNPRLEEEFVFGRGWGYGNEIYLEKREGRTTGWVGYTLSWTYRKFNDINNGNPFFPRYDRRHDVSAVLIHELSRRLSITTTWVYGTGNAISLPVGRFLVQDINGSNFTVVPEYLQRNSFRMAPYHRLDVGLVWRFFPKWGESDLTLSVYNAYNRKNPYFIYFEEVRDRQTDIITGFKAKQVSLFPVIPSITYNFKF
ncbi:TonB-dependent receptor [Rhodocytophaga aerolata]|uniref:TonB-dependent receptor n=1 Tax=Rhodocytophaga aerolata TaxID=455078 RepID=A0ABT8R8H6_9BACT|nr:TonB-dependent receptor [Rhodocytophaga aerolata]MDO1447042.1 TonB-dependent receptor [Rhodocytophaga aerolata]